MNFDPAAAAIPYNHILHFTISNMNKYDDNENVYTHTFRQQIEFKHVLTCFKFGTSDVLASINEEENHICDHTCV